MMMMIDIVQVRKRNRENEREKGENFRREPMGLKKRDERLRGRGGGG